MKYFDYNATSLLTRHQIQMLVERIPLEGLGNPSSVYQIGQTSAYTLERVRRNLANVFCVESSQIYFTSGATESNHLGVLGVLETQETSWKNISILSSCVEHASVRSLLKTLTLKGANVTFLNPNKMKIEDLNQIDSSTRLLIFMAAQHEIGWGLPVREIAQFLAEKRQSNPPDSFWHQIEFHVDATQAFGKLPLSKWFHPAIDSFSLSCHKIGGLAGLGVLILGQKRVRYPLFFGGGQEKGLRSGTENLLALLSLEHALTQMNFEEDYVDCRYEMLQLEKCLGKSSYFVVNSNVENETNLPNTVHVSLVPDCSFQAQDLISFCDLNGFAISSGSACSSGLQQASLALEALFAEDWRAKETLRLSVNPREEVFNLKLMTKELGSLILKGCETCSK
jgi:cysteine desulfurase